MTRAREYGLLAERLRKLLILIDKIFVAGGLSPQLYRTRGYVLMPRAI